MKKKVIKVTEVTSIEVPMENLTVDQFIQIQCKVICKQAEAQIEMAKVRRHEAEQLGKMIDLMISQYEAKHSEISIQRLLNQSNQRRLN